MKRLIQYTTIFLIVIVFIMNIALIYIYLVSKKLIAVKGTKLIIIIEDHAKYDDQDK